MKKSEGAVMLAHFLHVYLKFFPSASTFWVNHSCLST